MPAERILRFVVLTLLLLLTSAQSFDCRKAASAAEKLICADRALAALDEQLARAFAAARARGDVDVVNQRAWLKDVRGRCADAACLTEVYRARIEGLGRGLAGEWTLVGSTRHSGGVLVISEVSDTAFAFVLSVRTGMRMGEIEGVARRTRGAARFVDDETRCEVRLRREGTRIRVTATSPCAAFAGMGVGFDGEYGIGEPEPPPVTLTSLEVLHPRVTEAAFSALTGADHQLFVSSLDDMWGEQKDLDGFGAKIVLGWTRISGGEEAAIVMSRADGMIYAAVIDGDVIKYFSNDPAFRTQLPATISAWRDGFPDKKLVFASR